MHLAWGGEGAFEELGCQVGTLASESHSPFVLLAGGSSLPHWPGDAVQCGHN